jgi:hypothetical protein
MAKSDPRLPNGKRDNFKANPPEPAKQDPGVEKAKKKVKNPTAPQYGTSPKSKEAPKSNKPTTRPMPAPKGTASGMGGKVAKGSKNPIRKLVNRVKRGK